MSIEVKTNIFYDEVLNVKLFRTMGKVVEIRKFRLRKFLKSKKCTKIYWRPLDRDNQAGSFKIMPGTP